MKYELARIYAAKKGMSEVDVIERIQSGEIAGENKNGLWFVLLDRDAQREAESQVVATGSIEIPEGALVRSFEIEGKGEKTGRKRKRTYRAHSKEEARQLAEADGTIADRVTELALRPATERQLEYAIDLG
jgi:hypothetical protein